MQGRRAGAIIGGMWSVAFALALQGVDAKALQGAWKGERFTEGNGKDGARGEKVDFVFKDGTLTGAKGNASVIGAATFTVAEDGKSIDATGTSGGYRGKTYQGILKLEGDTLTWCCSGAAGKNQKRPADFRADAGQAHYLIILQRQKP